jgi:hypothetical protein
MLWVGTGAVSSDFYHDIAITSVGLLKTTDGGQTWTQLGQADLSGQRILSVVPTTLSDPITHEQVILVACGDGAGVMRSGDGGQTFTTVSQPTALANLNTTLSGVATSLVEDPNNPSQFYAALAGQGIYESADGGLNWHRIDDSTLPIASSFNIKLAVANDSGTTLLYAAVDANTPSFTDPSTTFPALAGVFRTAVSSTGAAGWSQLGGGRLALIPTSPSVPLLALTVDPGDPNVAYVSAEGAGHDPEGAAIFRVTASDVELLAEVGVNGQPHVDSRSLTFLNDNTLLETDDGGVYSLSNFFDPNNPQQISNTSWVSLTGNLADTEFFSIAYDTTFHEILGGTQDNGTVQQLGPADPNWGTIGGGDGAAVAFAAPDTNYYFEDGRFIRNGFDVLLGDGNSLFDDPFSGLTPADRKTAVAIVGEDASFPFAVGADSPLHILVGGSNLVGDGSFSDLYVSHDGGDTLSDITPLGLTDSISASTLGVDDPNAVYLATHVNGKPGNIYLGPAGSRPTLVAGPNWGNDVYGTQILVDPADFQHVYLLDNTGHIWQGSGVGATDSSWVDLTDNLVGSNGIASYVEHITFGPDGMLLAAGRNGVFRRLPFSGPAGFTGAWTKFGTGLPNVEVTALEYVPPDPSGNPLYGDFLLVGTYGRGAWIVPNASSVLTIPSTLEVTGDENGQPFGADHIVMQLDPADSSKLQIIDNGKIEYDDSYAYFSSVNIDANEASSAADPIDIHDIPASLSVTVNQPDGGELNVGNNGSLQSIQGQLEIAPGSFSRLTLDDSMSPAPDNPQNVTIIGLGIAGLTRHFISYGGGLASLAVRTGGGVHIFDVESTLASTPVFLGLGGLDTVNVSQQVRQLSNIAGPLTVVGNGFTSLVLDDKNEAEAKFPAFVNTYTLDTKLDTQLGTLSTIQSSYSAEISYTGVNNVTLNGDDGFNVNEYQVNSVAVGSPLEIDTGDGFNAVTVYHTDASGNKTQKADVQVNNGHGVTVLVVVDKSNPSTPVQIGNSVMLIGDPVTIGYNNVQSVTLYGPISGAYDFEGTPAGTPVILHLGAGPNTFQGSVNSNVTVVSTVTTTADSGPGSLRQAIMDANAAGMPAVIDFSILTTDTGYDATTGAWTIMPHMALPVLNEPAILDGTSQPGYVDRPIIALDGADAGAGVTGLTIAGGNSTVMGLDIGGFSGDGIDLTTIGTDTIQGNYIGTDVSGTRALANGGYGVGVVGISGNTIGGLTDIPGTGTGNLISGNTTGGIELDGSSNTIEGNLIGVDQTGNVALGNGYGVVVLGPGNTIGGTVAGAGNVISGNGGEGVFFYNATAGTGPTPATGLVAGNLIGLGADGTTPLGNRFYGVYVALDSRNVTIGGSTTAARNVISDNVGFGIITDGEANGLVVQGNYIGTDLTGELALGNHGAGVFISSPGVLVGGLTATPGTGPGNVVSANGNGPDDGGGIAFSASASGDTAEGNIVGLDASGTTPLGKFPEAGIVSDGPDVTIGGTAAGAGNIISGDLEGVVLETANATADMVQGNYVGTDISGTHAVANLYGVVIASGATNNTIGGTAAGAGNVISGNTTDGVLIASNGTTGEVVAGNFIGTDNTGNAVLLNVGNAVEIDAGAQATVSGSVTGNVSNAGTIDLSEPGLLNITGNYTQLAAGTLALGVGGATAGTQFDQLNVSGTATLAGTLSVSLLNGFVPPPASTYQVLTFAAHMGDFSVKQLGALDSYYNATSLTLIEPAPPTASLSGPTTGVLFQPLLFTVGASEVDPNEKDGPFTYTINWGDNSADTFVGKPTDLHAHAYASAGTYTVTLNVTAPDELVSQTVSQQVVIVGTPQLQNGTLAIPDNGGTITLTPVLPAGATAYSMKVTFSAANQKTVNFGTFTATNYAIYGGPGTDAVIVNGTASSDTFGVGTSTVSEQAAQGTAQSTLFNVGLNAIASLTLKGSGGSDTLTGPDSTNTWDLTAANAGTLDGTTSFTGIQNLIGGPSDDLFAFTTNTAAVSGNIDGGVGLNTLDYSKRSTAVTVNLGSAATGIGGTWIDIGAVIGGSTSSNTLLGGTGPDVWDINGTDAGTVNGTLAFAGFQNLTGGAGNQTNDTFVFLPGAFITGNLKGLSGLVSTNNTLDYSQYGGPAQVDLATKTATGIGGAWANIQTFNGAGTTDTIVGPSGKATWSIAGADSGTVGIYTFAGFANLSGGSTSTTGSSVFQFDAGGSLKGTITGGLGTNTLDYSRYAGGVYVNLQTLTATGAEGIAGIQNVTGSAGGGDILVGDGNNNILTELAGDNIVIGGGGGDTLTAGSGSDILIAGTTAYDQNVAALDALLAAWDNSALSYSARVAQLLTGVSYKGGTGLELAAFVPGLTVTQPAGSPASTLRGGAGPDWFFAAVTDVIKNRKTGEIDSTL